LVTGDLFNQTTGVALLQGINFTADWVNKIFTVQSGVNIGDVLTGTAYGLGGGNQLFRDMYIGTETTNDIVIPVNYDQIQELVIFVNGNPILDFIFEPQWATSGPEAVYNPVGSSGTTLVVNSTVGIAVGSVVNGTGFTGNQIVISKVNETTLILSAPPNSTPNGTLTFRANTGRTLVILDTNLTATDRATLVAFGPTTIGNTTVNYSWSAPVSQYISADGSLSFTLNNSLEYTNPVNLIVTVNGDRARTAAGIEHIADGSSAYLLPDRLGFSQAVISNTEVMVYVNDIPQILGVDFFVETFDGTPRAVEFAVNPDLGQKILIAVTTRTQCYINGDQLVFDPTQGLVPVIGDNIVVTTWNDTRQQDILTEVFVGPVTTGTTVDEAYDQTDFDVGTISGDPGSFDYSEGVTVTVNNPYEPRGNVCGPVEYAYE
jgi:hypothetical protein